MYMRRKKRSEKQNKYTLMVLHLLKELSKTANARLSLREIAKVLNINSMAVWRAYEKIKPLLDVKKGSEFEHFRLQVFLIRLKDEFKDMEIAQLVEKINTSDRLVSEYYKR